MEEIDEWLVKRRKVCPVCKGVVGEERVSASGLGGGGGEEGGAEAGANFGERARDDQLGDEESSVSGNGSEEDGNGRRTPNERTPLLGNLRTSYGFGARWFRIPFFTRTGVGAGANTEAGAGAT